MIRVTYYHSACVRIETPDLSVLCDPWLTEGAYDGSWYHYPPQRDLASIIPASDFVYVSHIHPDHYDPEFLRAYQTAHPECQVIIASRRKNYLSEKMHADGIAHQCIDRIEVDRTCLAIVPATGNDYDVDSALAVKRDTHSIVNMNDCVLDARQVAELLAFVGPRRPTIGLLGYTGAGSYPQTYHRDRKLLAAKAEVKKQFFFRRYLALRDALDPEIAIPFAGKYVLGGKLHELNAYRGVADACEVLAFDPRAVVLADGGHASIDTATLVPTATRTAPYEASAIDAYAASLADRPLLYERYFGRIPRQALPLRRLLPKAFATAHQRSSVERDYHICIKLEGQWFTCNANRGASAWGFCSDVSALVPRSELDVEPSYLFGLLTCVFHWNNAEIGSQYRTARLPDEHDPLVQAFLNHFHV